MMCLLLFASSKLSLSAKKDDIRLRPWSDGPLTWTDYQKTGFGDNANYSTKFKYALISGQKKVKIDNHKFVYYNVICNQISNESYYNSLKATEWDLRTDQVVFDIAELYSRYIQNRGLGNTSQVFYKTKDDYWERAQKEIDKFLKESNQGKDTSVVRKYEESVRTDLDRTPRKEPDLSMGGRVPDMWGFYFAYNRCTFLGKTSSDLANANGISIGFDHLGMKGWYFDFGFSGDFTSVKTQDFYFDPTYSYNWETGKNTNLTRFFVNMGHTLKSNQYFRLIPYAGIGYSELVQQSNTYNEKGNSYYASDFGGLSVMAGLNADWVFRLTVRPDEVVENSLRFKLFGAYDQLDGKNAWSVNVGLAFHLDVKSYNDAAMVFIPIPLFF